MLDKPEKAIRHFESYTNTTVTLMVCSSLFELSMPETSALHTQEQCNRVAAQFGSENCFQFDILNSNLNLYPDGCLKICRAGLLEWCIPVFVKKNYWVATLLAGVRRVPAGFKCNTNLPVYQEKRDAKVCRLCKDAPPLAGKDEIEFIAEGLRQLCARLEKWFEEMCPDGIHEDWKQSPRAEYLRYLIRRDCTRGLTLDRLASYLSLSPDRTRHLVQEVTGKNFRTLLMEARLSIAAQVLRNNPSVPVSVLAEHCGFSSISGFQHSFKSHYGCSPLEYRNSLFNHKKS